MAHPEAEKEKYCRWVAEEEERRHASHELNIGATA